LDAEITEQGLRWDPCISLTIVMLETELTDVSDYSQGFVPRISRRTRSGGDQISSEEKEFKLLAAVMWY
jgi:hypothetical protein